MQFIFEHNAANISSFLLKTIHYIKGHAVTPQHPNREQLLNRCKFIVTELCTNAIKHSGQKESSFSIYNSNSVLHIEKVDTGQPFSILWREHNLTFPLPAEVNIITLMEDDINRLRMQRVSDYSARFYTQQIIPTELATPPRLNEHFGLIIICMSSDEFVYTCDAASGTNTFTAVIKL